MDVDGELIELILMKDVAYIWNAKDWLKLRSLRIMGSFIGNLTALQGQDRLGGLPLALLKEETTLLLEKGFARLKTFPLLLKCPDEATQQKSEAARKTLFSQQVDILKERRKREIESKIDIILKGKIAKNKVSQTDENALENVKLKKEIILQEEFNKIKTPQEATLAIQICTRDPWLDEESGEEQNWEYPRENKECLHYMIFRDLWEKGYFITPGGKFGGDYLAYPGDPMKFHALFIVVCREKTSNIDMSEIITYGRLGQSVKKTIALAYINKDNEVSYQSIQWDGI